MKRSAALAPLSRDHHVALVVARELTRADSDGAAAAAARFVELLEGRELEHFVLEESLLLPAVPAEEPGPTLIARLLEDHEVLREAMRRLKYPPQPPDLDWLHEIGHRLRRHVQMEERELFPLIEESMTSAQLEQIGAALRSRH